MYTQISATARDPGASPPLPAAAASASALCPCWSALVVRSGSSRAARTPRLDCLIVRCMIFFSSVFPPRSVDHFFRPKSPHLVQNVSKSEPKDLRKSIQTELRKRFRGFLDFDATLSYNCYSHGSRTTQIYENSQKNRTKKNIQENTFIITCFLCKICKINEKVLPKWTRDRGERTVFFATFSAPVSREPPWPRQGRAKGAPSVAGEPKIHRNGPKRHPKST